MVAGFAANVNKVRTEGLLATMHSPGTGEKMEFVAMSYATFVRHGQNQHGFMTTDKHSRMGEQRHSLYLRAVKHYRDLRISIN